MASAEFVWLLNRGVDDWNKWRQANPEKHIDLRAMELTYGILPGVNFENVDLDSAKLMGTHLVSANLAGATLRKANLREVDFTFADLENADLRGAVLRGATLGGTRMAGANLDRADLRRADLEGVDLIGASVNRTNLSRATILNIVFGEIDLGSAIGLETIYHLAPSTLSTDTIQRSKGRLPESFLRGCGLGDLQIEMAKLAAPGLDPEQVVQIAYAICDLYSGSSIQYDSCFISYNNKDIDFAKRLHDNLQDKGVRCWFAPEDMRIGAPLRKTIGEQVSLRRRLLVILSANSIRSEWVGHEVEKAIAEEKEQGSRKLFPIRLDDAALNTRNDWAEAIRLSRHIGDFSDWRNESKYQKALERLLKDLTTTNSSFEGPDSQSSH